jgi:hypothetical protein
VENLETFHEAWKARLLAQSGQAGSNDEKEEAIMNNQNDIGAAQAFMRSRLDTLASITAANILIPGGPQERYQAIIEEAYTVLGLMETQLEALRMELEYHHKRLDEIRDARLSHETEQKP